MKLLKAFISWLIVFSCGATAVFYSVPPELHIVFGLMNGVFAAVVALKVYGDL